MNVALFCSHAFKVWMIIWTLSAPEALGSGDLFFVAIASILRAQAQLVRSHPTPNGRGKHDVNTPCAGWRGATRSDRPGTKARRTTTDATIIGFWMFSSSCDSNQSKKTQHRMLSELYVYSPSHSVPVSYYEPIHVSTSSTRQIAHLVSHSSTHSR